MRELERVRAQEREHSTRTIQQYQEEQTNLENIILAERDDRDQALERVRKLEAEIQEIRHQSEAQQQRGKTELQELQRKNETLAAQLNTMTDTIESLERELGEVSTSCVFPTRSYLGDAMQLSAHVLRCCGLHCACRGTVGEGPQN